MSRFHRVAAFVAALLLWPLAASAEPKVTEMHLENGMQIIVIEDHRAPVVTHMVWYRVGAADEARGESGIAHFFEHLMFKGTNTIPEGAFSKIVADNGGTDNAFTSFDYTAYFQRIAAERLDIVMGMEADRMVNLVLTPELVATERAVILEERSQTLDNSPERRFGEQMDAALYLNHPYGVSVIGWRHEIAALNIDDALAFYRAYYSPDNAILVVAGDVTPEEVLRLAKIHYGPVPPSGKHPEPRPIEPPQIAARRIEMTDPRVGQPYVIRSYLVPSQLSGTPEEAAALTVLAQILGSGINSRFATALERGAAIAVDTGAWYSAWARDATDFSIYAMPGPGATLDDVERALDAELERLIAEGVTEEELERVKRLMRTDEIYEADDQSSLARKYGRALAVGLAVSDVQSWTDRVAAVTAEDVRRAAAEHLLIERSVTGRLMTTAEGN